MNLERKIARSQLVLRDVFVERGCRCPVAEKKLALKKRSCQIWSGKNELKEAMICCFILPNAKGKCKLCMDLLKVLSVKILERNVHHVIFVCDEEKTRVNYQVIAFLELTFKRFEVLSYDETQNNILKNVLVPRYTKLAPSEAKMYVEHKDREMSRLIARDPVCRILGLQIDDVVEAKIACAIAGEYTIFKRVIPDH